MNKYLPLFLTTFIICCTRVAMACQPVVTEQPTDIALCPTGNHFFFADFDDNTATFQWQQSVDDGAVWTDMTDAYPFTGTSSEVLYLDSAYVGLDSLMFRCVATNGCGSTTTDEIYLTVATSLDIFVTPDPTTVYIGESAFLTGHGASFYYWTPEDDFIDTVGAYVEWMPHPAGTYNYTVFGALRGCQTPVVIDGLPVDSDDTCDWTPQDSCVATKRLDTLGHYIWYYDYDLDSIRICPCERFDGYGGWDSFTGTINVLPNITPAFGSPGAICQGDPAPSLPSSSTNGITGTWSPPVVDNMSSGTYTFTPDPGQHADPATMTVAVSPPIIPVLSHLGTYCEDQALSLPLPSASNNGITGSWSPSFLDTSIPGTQTYTFTPDPGQCATTGSTTFDVLPLYFAPVTGVGPFCVGSTASLPGQADGSESIYWIPATINTSVVGTTTYTYKPNFGSCIFDGTIDVVVLPAVTSTFAPLASVCQNDTPPALPATSNEGISGTWTPSSFSTGTVGTFTATFTPAAGQCASSATLSLTVNWLQDPHFFSIITSYCPGNNAQILPTTSDDAIPVTGSWSPPFVNPNTQGSYTCVFTADPGQCASGSSVTIDVYSEFPATFTPLASLCVGAAAPVLPSTSLQGDGGTWSPTSFNTAAPGTYTSTFTPYPGQCASSSTLSLIVDDVVEPTFAALNPVCVGTSSPVLSTTSTNGVTGTWMPASFSTSVAGTTVATFTPSPGQCAETTTLSLIVNGGAVAVAASGPLAFCDGASVVLTSSLSSGNVWSPGGETSQSITIDSVGVYYVSNNAGGCNSQSAPQTVVVNPLPVVVVGGDTPLCQGEVLQLTSNFLVGGSYSWLGPNGFSSTIQNPVINSAMPSNSGTYLLTITSPDGCVGTNEYTIQVNAIPAVSLGTLPSLCENHDPVLLVQGIPSGGMYAGTGVVDDQQFDPGISGDGTFTVTYSWSDGNCTGAATGLIVVDDCAGLVDQETNTISIYPNPATNVLFINAEDLTIEQLLVIDQAGRLVMSQQVTGNAVAELDLKQLERGVYLLVIQSYGEEVIKRFIRQ